MLDTEKLPSPELLRQLGPVGKFKPFAQFVPDLKKVVVFTKDCSYTPKRITSWLDLFIDNGSALEEIIGFAVYCPESFGLYGEIPVSAVLGEIIEQATGDPFEGHLRLMLRLLNGLMISLPCTA